MTCFAYMQICLYWNFEDIKAINKCFLNHLSPVNLPCGMPSPPLSMFPLLLHPLLHLYLVSKPVSSLALLNVHCEQHYTAATNAVKYFLYASKCYLDSKYIQLFQNLTSSPNYFFKRGNSPNKRCSSNSWFEEFLWMHICLCINFPLYRRQLRKKTKLIYNYFSHTHQLHWSLQRHQARFQQLSVRKKVHHQVTKLLQGWCHWVESTCTSQPVDDKTEAMRILSHFKTN